MKTQLRPRKRLRRRWTKRQKMRSKLYKNDEINEAEQEYSIHGIITDMVFEAALAAPRKQDTAIAEGIRTIILHHVEQAIDTWRQLGGLDLDNETQEILNEQLYNTHGKYWNREWRKLQSCQIGASNLRCSLPNGGSNNSLELPNQRTN